MPYNVRLKKYKNGTFQLTYYHRAIRTKDDYWRPYNLPDLHTTDYDDEDDDFDIDKWIELKQRSPFDMSYDPLQVTEIGSEVDEEIDEAADLEEEYISPEEAASRRERSLISSLNRSKRMIYDYGRANKWEWFFTLTFDPVDHFDEFNFSESKKKVSNWFHNIKKKCPKLKALIVPEQHESGAWHFHALVSNVDELTFEKAVNNQKFRKKKNGELMLNKKGEPVPNKYYGEYLRTSYPDGEYIYNIKEYRNGYTTATKITDTYKAVSYIVKYITKDLCECTFGKQRYLVTKNLDLPERTLGFCEPNNLMDALQFIEYKFGVHLSIDCIKTYKVDVPNYSNRVSVFEFNV